MSRPASRTTEELKLVFDIWLSSPTAAKASERLFNLGFKNGNGKKYSAVWVLLASETYVVHNPEYCRRRLIEHGAKQFQDDAAWTKWLISRAIFRLRRNPERFYNWAENLGIIEEAKKYDKYLKHKLTGENVVSKSIEVYDIVQEILEKTKPRS